MDFSNLKILTGFFGDKIDQKPKSYIPRLIKKAYNISFLSKPYDLLRLPTTYNPIAIYIFAD